MSIAKCYSAQLSGLSIEIISIEVDISNGLNAISIVGLGDRAVEESKDRMSAAIKNSGFQSPKQKNQKVVISLAPADVRKEGPSFDLAIAIAYLCAADELHFDTGKILFLGELALDGSVRRISGVLPILCQAANHDFQYAYIPKDNISEASLADHLTVYPVSDLRELLDHLESRHLIRPLDHRETLDAGRSRQDMLDMSSIRGNETAKRGLEIAAAGSHNILMYGPPGTGKTMLAQSFPSILPPLSRDESIEVTGIHSAAKVLTDDFVRDPPFRSPHHTASYPAIVGGGAFPKPGEITLAHRGVLFLDEFPEFDRSVLEAMRQPLEERIVTIARARGSVTFPAQCILIASMNPCPCGKPKNNGCYCSAKAIQAYQRKVSGPIMDRLDLWLNISKVDYDKLAAPKNENERSADIRARVTEARSAQRSRYEKYAINKRFNSEMNATDIERICTMTTAVRDRLSVIAKRFNLSGRGFHRIIKVSRTIADLAHSEEICDEHVLEAFQYRQQIDI